eukprot:5811481-Pleurochrysis_carterae.AAC.1
MLAGLRGRALIRSPLFERERSLRCVMRACTRTYAQTRRRAVICARLPAEPLGALHFGQLQPAEPIDREESADRAPAARRGSDDARVAQMASVFNGAHEEKQPPLTC